MALFTPCPAELRGRRPPAALAQCSSLGTVSLPMKCIKYLAEQLLKFIHITAILLESVLENFEQLSIWKQICLYSSSFLCFF